jgi:hypothetical protein
MKASPFAPRKHCWIEDTVVQRKEWKISDKKADGLTKIQVVFVKPGERLITNPGQNTVPLRS